MRINLVSKMRNPYQPHPIPMLILRRWRISGCRKLQSTKEQHLLICDNYRFYSDNLNRLAQFTKSLPRINYILLWTYLQNWCPIRPSAGIMVNPPNSTWFRVAASECCISTESRNLLTSLPLLINRLLFYKDNYDLLKYYQLHPWSIGIRRSVTIIKAY